MLVSSVKVTDPCLGSPPESRVQSPEVLKKMTYLWSACTLTQVLKLKIVGFCMMSTTEDTYNAEPTGCLAVSSQAYRYACNLNESLAGPTGNCTEKANALIAEETLGMNV